MSRKRTKQYLMLLMVVGLVSIAAGGSGTFASFTAETTNAGNYFATGTLILNDNGGTNTCTSAINSNNATPADSNNLNDTGTDCDTLFHLKKFVQVTGTSSGTITGGTTTTINYSAISGLIYKGDSVTIADGTHTDTVTAATTSTTSTGAGSFTVSVAPADSFTAGATITDGNPTYFANLTLTNAGSIDANGIKFDAGNPACTSKYTEGHGTLNTTVANIGDPSGSSLSVTGAGITAGSFQTGDPVVVTENGHAQTFIATGASTTSSIPVTGQNWNYQYDTGAIVSGPEFNGASAQAICGSLRLAIVETDSSFNQDLSTALSCAYGSTTNVVATSACDFAASPALSSTPTTLTPLTLSANGAAGSGNSNSELMAGKTRYFLLAVHYTGGTFDNTFQNTSAANLNLTWHIDQA